MSRLPVAWIELWDGRCVSGWWLGDMPGWGYRQAPAGLKTRRQLRAEGLCPGGQRPYGQLLWRHGARHPRWAWLYRDDLAQPKRQPSPAQRAALAHATAARRNQQICPDCGEDAGFHVVPEAGRIHDCTAWQVAA